MSVQSNFEYGKPITISDAIAEKISEMKIWNS